MLFFTFFSSIFNIACQNKCVCSANDILSHLDRVTQNAAYLLELERIEIYSRDFARGWTIINHQWRSLEELNIGTKKPRVAMLN